MFEEHTEPYKNLYCTLKELLQEAKQRGIWYWCYDCQKPILAYHTDALDSSPKTYCDKCNFKAYEEAWYASRDYSNCLKRHPKSTHISVL